MLLERIGYQQISDFIKTLSNENLTTVTIQQYLVAIRKVLNYAIGVGKLKSVPKFPAVKVTSKPGVATTCLSIWLWCVWQGYWSARLRQKPSRARSEGVKTC